MVATTSKWDLQSTSVVILGAGFSRAATNGKMPLMRDFFSCLKKEDFPDLHEFILQYEGELAKADFERILQKIDGLHFCTDRLFRDWPGAKKWHGRVPELRKQALDYAVATLKKHYCVPYGNWAASTLFSCGPETTVISMNYDVIADIILSNRPKLKHWFYGPKATCAHCRMRLLLERTCNCGIRQEDIVESDWRGILLKPHGSIAWRRCSDEDCCQKQCLVADPMCRPFDPCCCEECGRDCLPVLVMPDKTKKLQEIGEIDVMWRCASQAIASAESILFFGFRMPESDELLASLMGDQICEHRKLKRLGVIDLDPGSVISRVEKCLPRSCPIQKIELPVVADEVPRWIYDWNLSCYPKPALRRHSIQVSAGGMVDDLGWLN